MGLSKIFWDLNWNETSLVRTLFKFWITTHLKIGFIRMFYFILRTLTALALVNYFLSKILEFGLLFCYILRFNITEFYIVLSIFYLYIFFLFKKISVLIEFYCELFLMCRLKLIRKMLFSHSDRTFLKHLLDFPLLFHVVVKHLFRLKVSLKC